MGRSARWTQMTGLTVHPWAAISSANAVWTASASRFTSSIIFVLRRPATKTSLPRIWSEPPRDFVSTTKMPGGPMTMWSMFAAREPGILRS